MADAFEHDLREALGRACQAQNVSVIERGRREILALPRDLVLESIEHIAAETLPLDDDDWEFRRLLEVYEQLDRGLLGRLIERGLASSNAAIKEAAEDFREKITFDYAQKIGALSAEQRLRFYELLAFNLTIAVRVIGSDEQISAEHRLHRVLMVNEVEHRVTSKVRVLRLQLHEQSDTDFKEEINHWVKQSPEIAGDVGWAILRSYERATGVEPLPVPGSSPA